MTERQKENIEILRSQGESYKSIADALRISINTVKTFCRRSRLAAATETEIKKAEKKVSSPSDKYRRKGRTGPILCDVTVSYSDTDNEGTVQDVLNMLSGANYAR